MFLLLSLLGLASADCVVETSEAEVAQRAEGWVRTDTMRLRVQTGFPDCRRFHLRVDPSMRLTRVQAIVRQWDDTRTRLGSERLIPGPAGAREQTLILQLPELRTGDTLELTIVREGPAPGPPERPEEWWTDPRQVEPSAPERGEDGLLRTEVKLQLQLPQDGPHHFGAGGTVQAVHRRVRDFEGRAAGVEEWTVDAPAAGEHLLTGAYVFEVEGAGLILAGSGPGMDADSPGRLRFETKAGSAVASWRVVSAQGKPVLPSRSDVVSQIAAGALAASIPEPGLGMAFKGRSSDWEVVGEVVERLRTQVVEGRLLGTHPLKPRKLKQVRRSRWATPWEQALLLTRYLRQLKIDALPMPVRSVAKGRVEAAVPEGYTDAVVRVRLDGEERWVDPACGVCAVGEIRPGLWGGQVLAAELETLPEASAPRVWELNTEEDGQGRVYTLRLSAPWSTGLRRHLARFPVPERADQILEWAGVDGALIAHEGIAELGGAVTLRFRVPLAGAEAASEALEARRASP